MIPRPRALRLRREHPSPVALSRYLDHDLPARRQLALEQHVRDCVKCRRLLQSLSRTVRALGSLGDRVATGRAEAIIATLPAANGPEGHAAA